MQINPVYFKNATENTAKNTTKICFGRFVTLNCAAASPFFSVSSVANLQAR